MLIIVVRMRNSQPKYVIQVTKGLHLHWPTSAKKVNFDRDPNGSGVVRVASVHAFHVQFHSLGMPKYIARGSRQASRIMIVNLLEMKDSRSPVSKSSRVPSSQGISGVARCVGNASFGQSLLTDIVFKA